VQSGKLSLPTLTLERVMTDKELLELAAKAAGGFVYVENMGWIEQDEHGNRGSWWNPFGDDGDALRLAVRLNVHIELHDDLVRVWYANGECVELHFNPGDKQGAARRAIVLAAVEIGKSL